MAKLNYSKIFLKDAVPTSVGGQAVMDGIMMQGPEKRALAMRLPSGEIYVETENVKPKPRVASIPFVRGCVMFFVSLIQGMRMLMRSADILEEHAPELYHEEPGKVESWLNDKLGKRTTWDLMMGFSVMLALVITLAVFVIFPTWITNFLGLAVKSAVVLNLFEGVLRICLFVLYILAIRRMEEMKTLFRYHGAEHKTIHCFENGLELTPENARRFYTLHPRCGTSFLVFVFIIALLLFSLLGWPNLMLRILSRLLLLPVIAGLSYELLKWAGRSDNMAVRILSYPGLMLQRLTTAEPRKEQLEVAIAALKAVLSDEELKASEEQRPADAESDTDAGHMVTETAIEGDAEAAPAEAEPKPEEQATAPARRPRSKRYSLDQGTVEHALAWGADTLGLIDNGRNEARMIFSYVTGMSRTDILLKKDEMLPESQLREYERLIHERLTGKPLQYITKVQEFMGHLFRVNPSVLIPRLDTEILAEQVMGIINGKELKAPEILDMCTGSGVLGVTMAKEFPDARVMLADIDQDAMSTAISNSQMNGVFERCSFVIGDLFKAIPDDKKYDVIISNPPYIPTAEIDRLSVEVRAFEPRKALDGGMDGLDFYRRIAKDAGSHLKSGGILALEIGCEQGESVKELLSNSGNYDKIAIVKDLTRLDRVVICERR